MRYSKVFVLLFIAGLWSILIISLFQFSSNLREFKSFTRKRFRNELREVAEDRRSSGMTSIKRIVEKEDYYNVSIVPHGFYRNHVKVPKNRSREMSIFVYGGSSVVLPEEEDRTADFPGRLQKTIDQKVERNVSIYNFGRPALTSTGVKNSINETIHLDPDLILVYTGHNDYIRSTISFFDILPNIFCERNILWRVFGYVDGIIDKEGYEVYDKDMFLERELLQLLTSLKIVEGEKIYHMRKMSEEIIREDLFKENIVSIEEISEEHNVPLVFSTVFSLQRPAMNDFIPLGFEDRKTGKQFYENISELEEKIDELDFSEGIRRLEKLERKANRSPAPYRLRGKLYMREDEEVMAQKNFRKSLDLNIFRLDTRVHSSFNDVVRERKNISNTTVLDLHKELVRREDHPLLREDFFSSSIHLKSSESSDIVAESLFSLMEEKNILPG